MKWLFIDHEYHKRTGSAKFFLDIVRKSFSVDEHYYNRYYRTQAEKVAADYDGVIIWEFPISRKKFFFREKKNVFVPMYDNEWASYWQWKRIAWSGMGVISFCDKVTTHAKRCGVKNIIDVRYFPDPAELPQISGDPKRVFLWERGEVGRKNVERLFPSEAGFSFDIKPQDEILPRDVYLRRLAECGIVVAPRRKEGIGMAFLEAMAMGKCVAAHDDATMNEYIKNGETGILFTFNGSAPVSEETLSRVRANIPGTAAVLRERWLNDAAKIKDFLLKQPACRPPFFNRLKITLSYPLFLLEGFFMVLRRKVA
jgi:hypothetical protein